MNPIDVDDIETYWRVLSDTEQAKAEQLLAWAWADLSARSPGLPQRIESGQVSADLLRIPVLDQIVSVMRNPEGWDSEQLDDWRGSRSRAPRFVWSDDLLSLIGRRKTSFSIFPAY